MAIALSIWIGCLIGSALFYAVGMWLAEPVLRPVLDWLGLLESFTEMSADLGEGGLFWTVFLVSFSPAPMQVATLGAGAVHGNFFVFLAAIATSRGLRYFGLALLARLFGPRIAELDIPTGRLVVAVFVVVLIIWGGAQLFGQG